jgi:chaperonin GroES
MEKKLIPMGSNITVEKDKPVTVTPGGILLPDGSNVKDGLLTVGKVVGVGPGLRNFYGQRYEPEVFSGEYVLYKDFAGSEFKDTENPDKVYVILREADVLGVFRDS